jgi:hypothetical protein
MIKWRVSKKELDWITKDSKNFNSTTKLKSSTRLQMEVSHAMDFYLRTGNPNFLEKHSYEEELQRLENTDCCCLYRC